jgi:hypothetical protein
MTYGHDLKQGILKALAPDPPILEWFFVSLRDKATGEFAGASIGSTLSGSYWHSLPNDAQELIGKQSGIGIGEKVIISREQLPAEQYRNRLLTREEVTDILATMQSKEGTN